MRNIKFVLIPCGKRKREKSAPAKDLYTSALFKRHRAYAESLGAPWFILSAKHGLLHPDELVEPYNVTMNKMPKSAREDWSLRVQRQLDPHIELTGNTVVMTCGVNYQSGLLEWFQLRGVHVYLPLKGVGLFKQSARLKELMP